MTISRVRLAVVGSILCWSLASVAHGEQNPTLSLAGVPGVIDMPSGEALVDGSFATSFSKFGPISRTTLSFQISPRVSGSFRYSGIGNYDENPDPAVQDLITYFDRSFDVRFLLWRETRLAPSVSLGFQDVIGTGFMSGEYISATKGIGEKLKFTAGLGWGRLGSNNAVGAPFGPRPDADVGLGGKPRLGQWFKGDMAPFAAVEWQVSPKLTLKAEYSSDAYLAETVSQDTFERKSPFNFGVEYRYSDFLNLGVYSLYASEIGFSAQIILDPKTRPRFGPITAGPLLIKDRPVASGWSQASITDGGYQTSLRKDIQKLLAPDGIIVEALSVTQTTATLRFRNTTLDNSAQALGRISRALARVMPSEVETFYLVPSVEAMALSQVKINRSDLERLEFAPGQDQQLRGLTEIAAFSGAAAEADTLGDGLYRKFSWNVRPYLRASVFDPKNPYRVDLGARLSARYDLAPGLSFSGSLAQRIVGNLDTSDRVSDSVLPHVRSEGNIYDAEGQPAIETLTFNSFGKPGANLYSRLTVGYLERMFGGVSAEVMWKRVDRPFALGIELNYVKQRDFDQMFGFQDYSVLTGHVSGYYAFGGGYLAQLDVGRYLAGDMGATISIDREFGNGWKIGAFATLTDVPFEDFGEGSFDKGIKIEIPVAWIMGTPTRKTYKNILRPLSRDGGAKLELESRLYDVVREYHVDRLDAEWGKFWQ
jgi:hypothetical protein